MRSVLKPARRLRIGQVSDAEIIRLMRYCTLETLILRATAFATSDLATVTFTATPGVFTLTTPAAELELPILSEENREPPPHRRLHCVVGCGRLPTPANARRSMWR